MFLHIGNGKSVRKKNIIGIFDLDTSTVSKKGKDFINKMEKSGNLEYDDFDLPRSFVLSEDQGEYNVKLSRISSVCLKTRAEEEIYDGE